MASNIEINSLKGQLADAQDEVNGYFDDDMRQGQISDLKNKIANIVLNKGINDKKIPALLAPIIETAPAQQ